MSSHDDPKPGAQPDEGGDPTRHEDFAWRDVERSSGTEEAKEGAAEEKAEVAPSVGRADRGRSDRAGRGRAREANMLPGRGRRRFGLERLLVRLIATGGVIGIGVALGAILASSNVQGWIIGLVVAGVSVVLSAILWSSRQL
jgi:hypothetical protein